MSNISQEVNLQIKCRKREKITFIFVKVILVDANVKTT